MTVVVMGVAGSGKSTVARALADQVGGLFFDADDYHPPENRDKMSRGIPLTDDDRAGWLATLAALLRDQGDRPVVLACSALKEAYRNTLRVGPQVRFAFLKGSFEVLSRRIEARTGHFMKSGMLESQFRTLEEPAEGPDTVVLDVENPVEDLVAQVVSRWFAGATPGSVPTGPAN